MWWGVWNLVYTRVTALRVTHRCAKLDSRSKPDCLMVRCFGSHPNQSPSNSKPIMWWTELQILFGGRQEGHLAVNRCWMGNGRRVLICFSLSDLNISWSQLFVSQPGGIPVEIILGEQSCVEWFHIVHIKTSTISAFIRPLSQVLQDIIHTPRAHQARLHHK